ncbi:MAG: tetratricopeptide repeat protein [Rhodanobacteraceae bacterium]
MAHRGFWRELKRRNVLRAAVLYAGAVWAFSQGISQLTPALGLPDWATRWFLVACVVGFPFWVAFAWFYEFTPQGLKRDAEVTLDASSRHSTARKLDFAIIGIMAVAIVLLVSGYLIPRKAAAPTAASSIPAKSIAVLPFENLSNDKDNDYFVAGMQDLILTKLADIGAIKVISRTSTLSYGSHPENLTTIGQQLGVATLLEGSVQKAGNQVLINVQLIDAKTDAHIWAQSYQRTLNNVFGVEGDVAGQIATALNAKLSPAETQRLAAALSNNPAANDLYLRAEYFANQGDINYATAAWKQAIPLYQQAIAKVPGFALARARLSFTESILAWFAGSGEDVQQLTTDARTQAAQALALAPNLAEAHLAIGYSDYYGLGDYAGALKAFAAALTARPNDADALAATSYVLSRQGRFEAAIAALQQALALDPRNSRTAFELGVTYMQVSRYAEAEATLQHALALDPDNLNAKIYYSNAILYASGDVARAWAAAQGAEPRVQLQRVSLLTYQRKYQEALALLAGIPDTSDSFWVFTGSKAKQQADLYRLAGDAARAKSLYEKALPLAHAQLKAQAGSDSTESLVWRNVADIELGLGHTSAGLAAIAQSQALMTRTHDHEYGPWVMELNAGLYAEAGRPDLAVPLLANALVSPGLGDQYSPVLLWLDPAWDPIRHDPRFQALLKKNAGYKPALTAATSASTP